MGIFFGNHISVNIFHHGAEFYNSYEKLKNEGISTTPGIVCLVFSIEIFLKSLEAQKHYKEKYQYPDGTVYYDDLFDVSLVGRGHDLSKLFGNLSDKIRVEILTSYKEKYHSDLSKDISKIKSTFIDWRYIYEGNTFLLHQSTLENISTFLYLYIKGKLGIN